MVETHFELKINSQRPVHLVVGDWGEVGRQGRRETGDGGHQQQDLRRFSENRSLKTR